MSSHHNQNHLYDVDEDEDGHRNENVVGDTSHHQVKKEEDDSGGDDDLELRTNRSASSFVRQKNANTSPNSNGDDDDNDDDNDRISLLDNVGTNGSNRNRNRNNNKGLVNMSNAHGDDDDDDDDRHNSLSLRIMNLIQSMRQSLTRENIINSVSSLLYTYKQFIKFTINDIRAKKITFAIGLASCFIVVWMVVMCVTALDQVPLIFMRLGELDAGEFDLRIQASQYSPGVSLNYTSLLASIRGPNTNAEDHKAYSYFSPRMGMYSVTGSSATSCSSQLGFDPNANSIHDSSLWTWMYLGVNNQSKCGQVPKDRELDNLLGSDFNNGQYCVPALCTVQSYQSIVFIYDHDIENKMQLGRKWSHPKLEPGEVYLTSKMASELKVKNGDVIILTIPLMDQFIGPFREAKMLPDDTTQSTSRITFNDGNVHFPVKVKKIFDYTEYYGKMSTNTNNAVMIEYSTLMPHLAKFLPPQLFDSSHAEAFAKVDLYTYAEHVYINHPPSRLDVYNENDYDVVQKKLVDFASKGLYLMGYDQVQAQFPVLDYMRNTRFFAMFLGLIISIIVTILTTLSIILIYSLLMINVENRTFEMGVLRMIGIKLSGVVQLILVQAFFYAIPGWILGVILGQASFIGVAVLLARVLQVEIAKMVTWRALGLATALGIIIPLISSILPIWTALGQNLTESLDVGRSKTKAVKFSIDRASEASISWTSILVGLFMTIFGAAVYYFFPLALLSLNLSFLLYMFFGLLLAMLLGLIMLSLNVENMLEFVVTWAFFFWENYAVRDIVMKNLVAHRLRNRKTTIMFSLSLGFIIFLTLSFTGQIRTFQYNVLRSYGTQVNLVAGNKHSFSSFQVKRNLEEICTKSAACSGYSYISYQLREVAPYGVHQIMNKGKWKSYSQDVYAVSPNFFDITGDKFIVADEQMSPDSKFKKYGKSLSYLLYTVRGSFSALIGSLYKSELDIGLDKTYLLESPKTTKGFPLYEYSLMKPLAFLSGAPVGSFSKFPLVGWQSSFVSFPTYVKLSNGSFQSVDNVPIQKMLIDVNSKASNAEFKELVSKLQTAIRHINIRYKDMNSELSPLSIATQVLDFFFVFTTVVAMSICFFSLMSSMYSNINEQAKEIGVLRAIGARKWTIVRIFIYEAFILIVSASIMGILIGLSIGYTMALQNSLFTQLPADFILPWKIILVVFGLAAVFSFISSIGPIVNLLRLPIVTILRRLIS